MSNPAMDPTKAKTTDRLEAPKAEQSGMRQVPPPQNRQIAGFSWVHLLALLAGNAFLAMGPWFVRLADTGPVSAGFWRLALALPVIALLAWRTEGNPLAGPRTVMLAAAVAGVFFGLDLASWHIGIEMTRLGNATLFGNSGSLILMVWAFVLLRRLPIGREWLAIVAALAGAAILIGRSAEISTSTVIGDLFCLLAGLCYAFYLLILQGRRQGSGPWSLLTWSGISAALVLLSIALVLREPVWPGDWTPVITLAVTSQLIGQGLLVYSLRNFTALIIGLALLTQPAIAATIGWFVFGEHLGGLDILGMALLASALVIAKLTEESTKAASLDRHAG